MGCFATGGSCGACASQAGLAFRGWVVRFGGLTTVHIDQRGAFRSQTCSSSFFFRGVLLRGSVVQAAMTKTRDDDAQQNVQPEYSARSSQRNLFANACKGVVFAESW